jgi:hypothetical protein
LHDWDKTEFLDAVTSDEPTGPDTDERSTWRAGGIINGKENPGVYRRKQSQCQLSTKSLA